MSTFLIIFLTLFFDFFIGFLFKKHKESKIVKIDEKFEKEVLEILTNSENSMNDRIQEALELTRETKGKTSFGSYLVLDTLQKIKKW